LITVAIDTVFTFGLTAEAVMCVMAVMGARTVRRIIIAPRRDSDSFIRCLTVLVPEYYLGLFQRSRGEFLA
jgi:hypothetical protein